MQTIELDFGELLSAYKRLAEHFGSTVFDRDGYFCSVAVLNSVISRNALKCLLLDADVCGLFYVKACGYFSSSAKCKAELRSFLTLSKINRWKHSNKQKLAIFLITVCIVHYWSV